MPRNKVMVYRGGDWVVVPTGSDNYRRDTDSDSDGGVIGDKRMNTGGKTLPRKRSSGASRVCNDAKLKILAGGVIGKHDIKLFGNSWDRNRAIKWSLSEQLRSVRGLMERVGEVEVKVDHRNESVDIADQANVRSTRRRMNDNNADARRPSSLVNVDEAKASKKAFKGCMSLLSKMLKHMSSEICDAKVVEKRMNLSFIKTKLKSKDYKYPSQFAGEMRLEFKSAMTSNPPGRFVYEAAKAFSEIFDDRLPAIETEYVRGAKLAYFPD